MIHPSAIISPKAKIDNDVIIGPFCTIGDNVIIKSGTLIRSHVVIDGKTEIGRNNIIYPFTTIGLYPQDLKFNKEDSQVIIGDNNTIRENVTIHLGTKDGGMITKIGSHNLLMVGVHIAHDCLIGDHNIFANNATLAGHVVVGNRVVIGGLSAIHQFVRIGNGAMIGGMSGVESDVIPYSSTKGERASLAGINIRGLKRNNFVHSDIQALNNFYKLIFEESDKRPFLDRVFEIAKLFPNNNLVHEIIEFLKEKSDRSYCKPKNN